MKKEKFEEALARLEEIVRKLESGNMSLEDSLKAVEIHPAVDRRILPMPHPQICLVSKVG